MDFKQLLSGLAEEHRKLQQERNELSEEVSKLREALSSQGALVRQASLPSRLERSAAVEAPPGHSLPGQLSPWCADGRADAADQAGVVTVRSPARRGPVELGGWRPEALEVPRSSRRVSALGVVEHDLLDERDLMSRVKQQERFLEIFDVEVTAMRTHEISAKELGLVLGKRGLKKLDQRFLEKVISELARISAHLSASKGKSPEGSRIMLQSSRSHFDLPRNEIGVGFEAFVDAIMMPDLPKWVEPSLSRGIKKMQATLLKKDVEEVITKLSRKRVAMNAELAPDMALAPQAWVGRLDFALNVVVFLTVVASVLCLVLSTETDPDWQGWFAMEIVFAVVFVGDSVSRIWIHGRGVFWCGPERRWNWLDVTITCVAVFDIGLTLLIQESDNLEFGRFALVLRFFRLMRLARLLKLVHSPLIRELSNMLVGFVLGSPALFWVSILIWVVVGLMAMGLRIAVGPAPDEAILIDMCGPADSPLVTEDENAECAAHKLYAEEYCASLPRCMFTVFRCIIGDCTSKGGHSLAAHLSRGFGVRFEITYLVGMIIITFGLFNVITAIFVEATMSGLKYNDARQKLRSVYEHKYVKKKLKQLALRIHAVSKCIQQGKTIDQVDEFDGGTSIDDDSLKRSVTGQSTYTVEMAEDPDDIANINLTEDEFFAVFEDRGVRSILKQLDIEIEGAGKEALFEVMDSNYSGTVDVASMIDTLMKLRGGPMKVDMIAPTVALRGLQQELRLLVAAGMGSPAAYKAAVADHHVARAALTPRGTGRPQQG